MSVFKEIKAGNKFEEELMADAKPQINVWLTGVKKPGVDGDQVISDFKNTLASKIKSTTQFY